MHERPQTPLAQLAAPLVVGHAMRQAPQWVVLVFVFVSQPFVTSPSQSAQPALQAMWQVEAVQVAVPLVRSHALAHAPQ